MQFDGLQGFKKFIDSVGAFDAKEEIIEIVKEHTENLADLQRDQMLEGKGVDGEFIHPFYSENPYFETREQAEAYAEWKSKIKPNPQKPKDVPNLYINGYFHRSIHAKVEGEELEIKSNAEFGDDVFNVHKNAKGLNAEKRLVFAEAITLPEFGKRLQKKTQLKL